MKWKNVLKIFPPLSLTSDDIVTRHRRRREGSFRLTSFALRHKQRTASKVTVLMGYGLWWWWVSCAIWKISSNTKSKLCMYLWGWAKDEHEILRRLVECCRWKCSFSNESICWWIFDVVRTTWVLKANMIACSIGLNFQLHILLRTRQTTGGEVYVYAGQRRKSLRER